MSLPKLRFYGEAPYCVAVLHGGPGAPGGMAPVARDLGASCGVLEPFQSADSLVGQVQELADVLRENGTPPCTMIGSSWGAMLGFILTAQHPALVGKLIMVGSGVFTEEHALSILPTRLSRLTDEEQTAVMQSFAVLNDPAITDKKAALQYIGQTFNRADAFDPLSLDTETLDVQFDIHQRVWADAVQLRKSGDLVELGRHITCPVLALHGDYDPHPVEGIREPLTPVLTDFRLELLENCGHLPWIERHARDRFFEILREEIAGL